ncbi:hypothetical protein FP744_10006210 [Trichoderma asperellum]|nr:hypothetical protein LI328DRAFT_155495 [Trichoderma asperelloides]
MTKKPSFLLLGISDLINASEVQQSGGNPATVLDSFLGRLCTNPNNPTQDWTPLDPSPFYELPPSIIEAKNAQEAADASTNNKVGFQLSEIVKVEGSWGGGFNFDVSAQTIRTFKLHRESHVLKAMWKDLKVRKEILETLDEQSKLYMIVGFKTCINADAKWLASKNWAGRLSLSVTEILTAAGVPIPPWLEVKIDAGCDRDKTFVQMASLFGERIIAVRYRQVARRNRILQLMQGKNVPEITIAKREATSLDGPMTYAEEEDSSEYESDSIDWEEASNDANLLSTDPDANDIQLVPLETVIKPGLGQMIMEI